MSVRGSELGLSFWAKKRPNPISSSIPLPLTMGTTGPPGVKFPAEKSFTVFVYLAQTVSLVVQRPLLLRVLSAAHSDMPFTDTHHPVIKMPAASIRSAFVRSNFEFQSSHSSLPNPPETERGSQRMSGVK